MAGQSLLDVHELSDQRSVQDLIHLMEFEFAHYSELGESVERFNGAERIDVLNHYHLNVVRNPSKLLLLLRGLKRRKLSVGYGLKMQNRVVHFVIEHPSSEKKSYMNHSYDHMKPIGICYFDQRRALSIKQVIYMERALHVFNLGRIVCFANNYSIPSIKAIRRINAEYGRKIIEMRYLSMKTENQKLIY